MEWYFILLIIFLAVMLVLFFPLFIQTRFYVNVLKNVGAISVTLLWIIPIVCFRFKLTKNSVKLIKKNQKEKEMKFFSAKSVFMLNFMSNFFKRLKLFELSFFSYCGKKNNAMETAFLNGYFLTFVHFLFVFIHNNKGEFVSHLVCDKDFENDELKISGYNSIFVFPLQILICLICAFVFLMKKQRKRG